LEAAHTRTGQGGILYGATCPQVPIQESIGSKSVVIHVEPFNGTVLVTVPQQRNQRMVFAEGRVVVNRRLQRLYPRQVVPLCGICHSLPFGGLSLLPIICGAVESVVEIVAYVRTKYGSR